MGSLTEKLNLNRREFGILVGTILGDAYIDQYPKNARIAIMHSLKQKEYVDWKYQELKRFAKMSFEKLRDKHKNSLDYRWIQIIYS